jgi:hypothetical protein
MSAVRMFCERKSGTDFDGREGRKGVVGMGHIMNPPLKIQIEELSGWCGGNGLDLYSGGVRFISRSGHPLPGTFFKAFFVPSTQILG